MHGYFGYGFPGNGYYGVGGFPWLGLLFMLVSLGIVVSLIVMGFRYLNSRGSRNDKSPSGKDGADNAFSILAERLARGEISKEEYEDLKETLKKN